MEMEWGQGGCAPTQKLKEQGKGGAQPIPEERATPRPFCLVLHQLEEALPFLGELHKIQTNTYSPHYVK